MRAVAVAGGGLRRMRRRGVGMRAWWGGFGFAFSSNLEKNNHMVP